MTITSTLDQPTFSSTLLSCFFLSFSKRFYCFFLPPSFFSFFAPSLSSFLSPFLPFSILGFELRALDLLGRCSTPWATLLTLLCWLFF
jgi:hypothetical protein